MSQSMLRPVLHICRHLILKCSPHVVVTTRFKRDELEGRNAVVFVTLCFML